MIVRKARFYFYTAEVCCKKLKHQTFCCKQGINNISNHSHFYSIHVPNHGYFKEERVSTAIPRMLGPFETEENRIMKEMKAIFLDVSYVDSHAGISYKLQRLLPTIVMFHSLPGSHNDLLGLAASLVEQNFRVIIINTYGYGRTKANFYLHDTFYKHSVIESTLVHMATLRELEVPRMDIVLGYGLGALAALSTASSSPYVKMLAMIAPTPFHTKCKIIEPFETFYNYYLHFYCGHRRLLLKLMQPFFVQSTKRRWNLPKDTPFDIVLQIFLSIGALSFPQINGDLKSILLRDFPTFLVTSEPDPYAGGKEVTEEFAELLGAKKKQDYDSDGQSIGESGKDDTNVTWISLQNGGMKPLNDPVFCDVISRRLVRAYDEQVIQQQKLLRAKNRL